MAEPSVGTALSMHDPRTIGPWTVHSRLGAGGMGVVYYAVAGGAEAAIKVIRPGLLDAPATRDRFRREVAILRSVRDLHISQYLDDDLDSEPAWLAVEYLSGPTLRDEIATNGPLADDDWWELARGLAQALSVLEIHRVTHRDLKPGNVILNERGPVLIDFGIAHPEDATQLTATGLVTGSPAWLSPEQANLDPIGPATDVFTLGSLLAFAATGRPPFGEGASVAVLMAIIKREPDLAGIDPVRKALLRRMLSKEPSRRPTARQILDRARGGGSGPAWADAHSAAPLAPTLVDGGLPAPTPSPDEPFDVAAPVTAGSADVAGPVDVNPALGVAGPAEVAAIDPAGTAEWPAPVAPVGGHARRDADTTRPDAVDVADWPTADSPAPSSPSGASPSGASPGAAVPAPEPAPHAAPSPAPVPAPIGPAARRPGPRTTPPAEPGPRTTAAHQRRGRRRRVLIVLVAVCALALAGWLVLRPDAGGGSGDGGSSSSQPPSAASAPAAPAKDQLVSGDWLLESYRLDNTGDGLVVSGTVRNRGSAAASADLTVWVYLGDQSLGSVSQRVDNVGAGATVPVAMTGDAVWKPGQKVVLLQAN